MSARQRLSELWPEEGELGDSSPALPFLPGSLSCHARARWGPWRKIAPFCGGRETAKLLQCPERSARFHQPLPSSLNRCSDMLGHLRADRPSMMFRLGLSPTTGPRSCQSALPRSTCSTAGSATCSMTLPIPTHDLTWRHFP